jgi:hypothetical protein
VAARKRGETGVVVLFVFVVSVVRCVSTRRWRVVGRTCQTTRSVAWQIVAPS